MFTKYLAVFLRRSYKANGLQRKVLISSGRRFLCFCGAKWHRNFKSCLYPERPLSAAYFFVECAEVFQRGTPVCVHLRQLVTRKYREDVLKVATSACKSSVCENTTLTTFIWKKVLSWYIVGFFEVCCSWKTVKSSSTRAFIPTEQSLSIFKMYFFTTAETSRAMFVYQSERRPCTLRRCPAGCQRVLPSRNKVPSYLRRYKYNSGVMWRNVA